MLVNNATWCRPRSARVGAASGLRLVAYAVASRLSLYSGFTLFLEDPVNGDQIEQA